MSQKNLELIDKWNYSFKEGDKVMFHPELEDFNTAANWGVSEERYNLNDYRGKIGVVKKCWSDLHAFGRGSSCMCIVDFNGFEIQHMAGCFVASNFF